jgi:hypothetical protein
VGSRLKYKYIHRVMPGVVRWGRRPQGRFLPFGVVDVCGGRQVGVLEVLEMDLLSALQHRLEVRGGAGATNDSSCA